MVAEALSGRKARRPTTKRATEAKPASTRVSFILDKYDASVSYSTSVPYSRSAWKGYSAKLDFRFTEFSEDHGIHRGFIAVN